MTQRHLMIRRAAAAVCAIAIAGGAAAQALGQDEYGSAQPKSAVPETLLVVPERLFDGSEMRRGVAVLVRDGKVAEVGPPAALRDSGAREIAVPGGTVLPGFIDMHTHHLVNAVPPSRALEHGVTTARDLGGPVAPADATPFQLRQLLSGPIITAKRGYPLPVFASDAGIAVTRRRQARETVRRLAAEGASVIAVSLEPGGSKGAPWSHHTPAHAPPWPLLGKRELNAVVREAHKLDRKVVAYLSGPKGVRLALDAGVDEWAHMPCDRLPRKLIRRAGRSRVAIDGTLDTLSHCDGVNANAKRLLDHGARLFYGTDMGHLDVPHGIDGEELHQMINAGLTPHQALAAATGAAGRYLGLAPLGRLVPGAPADLIAVGGDPTQNLKTLEYPSLVIAAGAIVVERAIEGGGHHPHH